MSMAALRWAREVRGIGSAEKLVLFMLADHADDEGKCWPSVAGLAEDGCMGERTVQRALSDLCKAGVINREGNGGRGLTRLYTLLMGADAVNRVPNGHPNDPQERVPNSTERVPDTTERVPNRRKRVPDWHPNPQEPSRTLKEPSKARASLALVVPCPAWLPAEAWADWHRYRKAKSGKGWTDHAAALALRDLTKLRDQGHNPVAVIEQSIASGWTKLYPLKASRSQQPARSRAEWAWEEMGMGLDQTSDTRPIIDVEAQPA